MRIGPGSLKCVTAWSDDRSLRELMEETLRAHVRAEHIRHLYDQVFLIYTDAETAAIRGWFTSSLQDGESVFVVEFERWSGYGPAPDRAWLSFRGH
jgi:hypothetical protein